MAWARILLLFGRFGRGVVQWLCISSLMDSKGNVRHFFGVLFAWRGFEFCCCSSVSEAFRERLLCTSLMDPKGNVRHFFGVLFAWRGFESCCCSGVSEPASKGLAANGFGTTSAARAPDKRWREAVFRYAFCLAWARILLLFGCFGTGLQRTCANGFGTTSAARVPDKSTCVYGFQR